MSNIETNFYRGTGFKPSKIVGACCERYKKVAAIGFEPTTQEKVNRDVAQVLGVE